MGTDSTAADVVQEEMKLAEQLLTEKLEGQHPDQNPRLGFALSLIRSVRVYSKSANGIPGLRGLGYEEARDLARVVIEFDPRTDHDLTVHSYKQAASSLTVAMKGKH